MFRLTSFPAWKSVFAASINDSLAIRYNFHLPKNDRREIFAAVGFIKHWAVQDNKGRGTAYYNHI